MGSSNRGHVRGPTRVGRDPERSPWPGRSHFPLPISRFPLHTSDFRLSFHFSFELQTSYFHTSDFKRQTSNFHETKTDTLHHDRRTRPPRRIARTHGSLEALGTVPERARLGHGARGLQPPRHRLGVLPARPRAIARISVERGWPCRHLGPPPEDLLRAGAVERARSHPQGTPVRPDRQRGQPRRGRKGVLLLSRQHSHALVHEVSLQVSAGRVSLRAARRREPAARQGRQGIRAPRHRRLRRQPVLRRPDRVREEHTGRRAGTGHRLQPRPRDGTPARAPDDVVSQHVVVGSERAATFHAQRRRGWHARRGIRAGLRHPLARVRERTAAALHRERDELSGTLWLTERQPLCEGRHQRLRRAWGARRGQP